MVMRYSTTVYIWSANRFPLAEVQYVRDYFLPEGGGQRFSLQVNDALYYVYVAAVQTSYVMAVD